MSTHERPKESYLRPHLLASNRMPPDVVIETIRVASASSNGSPILDIGAGDGRLVPIIRACSPDSPVVILDIDRTALVTPNMQSIDAWRVNGDALCLPINKQSVGMVLSVNVAHEVCGASTEEERVKKFRRFVQGIQSTLTPGGQFVLFDGIMPENASELVTMTPDSPEAQQKFDLFINSYTGRKLSVERLDENQYRLPLGDVVAFLTKLPYINSEYWEDERTQLYPFLSVKQMVTILGEEELCFVGVEHPIKRKGLPNFLKDYPIEGYDVENFPPVQVAILAEKL